MDVLWQLRQACTDAIRHCDQAEQQAKQKQEAASRQRQTSLAKMRQQNQQSQQNAEGWLNHARNLAQQGEKIMADLKLAGSQPTPFVLPANASLDDLARTLVTLQNQAQQALTRLSWTADELRKERRKWWKFW